MNRIPEGPHEDIINQNTRLNLNQIETLDLFLDAGISGNLEATDVLTSLRRFG